MLDEHAGSSVGAQRHNGFLKGFGIKGSSKPDRLRGERSGPAAPSQTAMENCLQKNPNINVVYTINEPSAAGAWTALKKAGKSKGDVTIVSVDGGCAGVRNVRAGRHRRDLAAVPAEDGVARRRGGRQVREDRQEGLRATPTPGST